MAMCAIFLGHRFKVIESCFIYYDKHLYKDELIATQLLREQLVPNFFDNLLFLFKFFYFRQLFYWLRFLFAIEFIELQLFNFVKNLRFGW